MTDEVLRCPDCGELLEGDAGEVPVAIEDGIVRVPFDCLECDAPLAITVESALPEALGVDLTVERRDAGEGPR